MADDNKVEEDSKETNWFSAELRMLETEYEKSKLQVYQDTLFCKRSMVELELLCKNEQLQKNVRVNNKLKEHECQLQEQLESLTSELKNATSQLRTAQNTLQDEEAHHQLEKKELEEKLNSEMERKMKEHKRTSKRENLLQEEIKTWQEKHVKVFKEAEDLRTELSKKNVAVKTKAIQAVVSVNNTSTMVQVDSQTCHVGVQVQDLALTDDRSRKNDDVTRKLDEDLRETNENGKRNKENKTDENGMVKENQPDSGKRKNERRVKAKNKPVQKCKEVNKDKENDMTEKETDIKRNVPGKRKSLRQASVTSQGETKKLTEKHQTATSTQKESEQSTTQAEKAEKQEEFNELTNASNSCLVTSAPQEDDIPFQYSTTPGRLQKLEEERKSLEKPEDQACSSAQDDTSGSIEEKTNVKKRNKVAPKDLPQLAVCIEDISNKEAVETEDEEKVIKEASQDHKDGAVVVPSKEQCVENEDVTPKEEQELLASNEAQIQLQVEEGQLQKDSEKVNSSKVNKQFEVSIAVQDVNEKMRKTCQGKKESRRKHKSRQAKPAGEKSSQDETSPSQGKRVLRSRAKNRNSEAQVGSNKGAERKSLSKQTRQKPQVSDIETVTTKKRKAGVECLEGHEPAMLDTSSHQAEQFPRESDMSSRETDPLVDEPRPVTSGNPAGDETSQQPEPEVLGELNDGNTCTQLGERLKDYKSNQGSLVLSDNQIRKTEDAIIHGCLHKALEEGKSPSQSGPHPDEKNNSNKLDLSSENNIITQTEQRFQGTNDVSASHKQDSDKTETNYSNKILRQTAKSTSRDKGHPIGKRNGQDPAALTAKSTKENTSDGKLKGRKKRKPTSSVREVLAPADQQSNSDCGTSNEISSMLDCTKKRKTLFNSQENSLMAPISDVQISFANTTLSKSRGAHAGIPPSLSAFMRSFIAPKLKKSH